MIMKFIGFIGLKILAKKIAKIVLNKIAYKELREMVAKTDNKIDDEIVESIIKALDAAVDKI